jgi:hypothetical protein
MPNFMEKSTKNLQNKEWVITFAAPKQWELSSAGSEHLPYKQRVIGSNPIVPTRGGLTEMLNPLLF